MYLGNLLFAFIFGISFASSAFLLLLFSKNTVPE